MERAVIAVSRMVLDPRLNALKGAIGKSKFSSRNKLARTYSEANFGGSYWSWKTTMTFAKRYACSADPAGVLVSN